MQNQNLNLKKQYLPARTRAFSVCGYPKFWTKSKLGSWFQFNCARAFESWHAGESVIRCYPICSRFLSSSWCWPNGSRHLRRWQESPATIRNFVGFPLSFRTTPCSFNVRSRKCRLAFFSLNFLLDLSGQVQFKYLHCQTLQEDISQHQNKGCLFSALTFTAWTPRMRSSAWKMVKSVHESVCLLSSLSTNLL